MSESAEPPGPATTVGEMGEKALVRHLRARIPLGDGVQVGPGDDAAAVETGPVTLVTTDALVEGIHFQRDWTPPQLLGRKALTVNLSDIAAMAGVPRYATVSLCLPPDVPLSFVEGLYDGLLERAAETGVSVVGGNISATTGPVIVDLALFGHGDRLLKRSGAMPGDLVVVTGALGAASAGLQFLMAGARIEHVGASPEGEWGGAKASALLHCLRAQLDPTPPLAFARALAEHDVVHAVMDISDGLSGDLFTLCQESDVSAWLDPATIPVDACAAELEKEGGTDGFSLALHGGEDYQLLLAVPPGAMEALREVAVVWDLPVTPVGEFAPGPPLLSLKFGDALRKLRPKSFEHFKPRDRRPDSATEA